MTRLRLWDLWGWIRQNLQQRDNGLYNAMMSAIFMEMGKMKEARSSAEDALRLLANEKTP